MAETLICADGAPAMKVRTVEMRAGDRIGPKHVELEWPAVPRRGVKHVRGDLNKGATRAMCENVWNTGVM